MRSAAIRLLLSILAASAVVGLSFGARDALAARGVAPFPANPRGVADPRGPVDPR